MTPWAVAVVCWFNPRVGPAGMVMRGNADEVRLMSEDVKDEAPAPAKIHPEFRNGSLTAISVLIGFSLSFLSRWAGTPGKWHTVDLVAVAFIVLGSATQIWALGSLLFVSSMIAANYERATRTFLVGLIIVALGVAAAILGEIIGVGHNVLGG